MPSDGSCLKLHSITMSCATPSAARRLEGWFPRSGTGHGIWQTAPTRLVESLTISGLKILFLTPGRHVPSARFRAVQYVRYLRRLGHQCTVAPAHPPMYAQYRWLGWRRSESLRRRLRAWDLFRARFGGYQIVVLQRELFDDDSWDLEQRFRAAFPVMILDVDDAVFLRHGKKFETLATICDSVVAGNAALAERAREFNQHVTLIPTTVDLERYAASPPGQTGTKPAVIGWTGTSGNLKELELIQPSLRELDSLKFELRIVSDRPDPLSALDLGGGTVQFIPWHEHSEIQDLQAFDIGVMPLADSQWSRYKCGLKILQYMAAGIPAVASPVGVNSEIICDGENGFLADTPARWTQVLEMLIADSELRRRIGAAGRRTVEESYSVQAQLPALIEVFEQTVQRVAGTIA